MTSNYDKSSMDREKYCYSIGEHGQESLGILEKSFNEQTEYFLKKAWYTIRHKSA